MHRLPRTSCSSTHTWEGRQVLQSSSIQKGINTAVLVLASTLHPSREELVQLPGFAGLDVPLLLVLEEREQLRIFHLGPVRIQLLMHLLAVLWIQWKARHLLRTAAGPRTIHIVNVVLATSQG